MIGAFPTARNNTITGDKAYDVDKRNWKKRQPIIIS